MTINKSEQYGLILLFFLVLTGKHYSWRTLPDATFHFSGIRQSGDGGTLPVS
jgi:hypothetical protein